ncbi:acetyl-CoA acetyltransferase [Mycolicibacterium sp.]|uniref:acetyl-CoA acetyltransferase n=1 Tax=Mycolicibacterium sp. TaxID=2320850 RepID=UPI001A35C056|nr:acetyl-CoA acetyltransferase [Mycolicibacterium sp.]MBJ7337134.1 acetyl-CoA acetyltransferase [Mycolicibacterium sp.]
MSAHLDPRTPVLVGVGQCSERIDDLGYRALSAVDLAAEAARAALIDCGTDTTAVARRIDTVAGVRQFEISTPRARAPFGKSNNYPRSVAHRIGADPADAILEVVGGQSPQHLVNEMSAAIAAGDRDVVMIFGSEAISTVRHLMSADEKPDFTETVDGQLTDRGYGLEGMSGPEYVTHGLVDAPSQYALLENARRARLAVTADQYRHQMAELLSPFTHVAAVNPFAASPAERTVAELETITPSNRMIADPYPRLMVARDQVNQGAAVLLMSVVTAAELAVPEEHWVYLHGHADLREATLLDRRDLSRAPSAVLAAQEALRVAGIEQGQIATFDLYSCFPIAVSNVCDGLGLSVNDPRGLTLTGGLPYFGGAGNNYSMHAIAETVHAMRKNPGSYGLVGANGGTLSKYSAGVYSTTPRTWHADRSTELQSELLAKPGTTTTLAPTGTAHIETYTVRHTKSGPVGIIVGRLTADDRRFLANPADDDDGLMELLMNGDPVGAYITVLPNETGNTARLAEEHR